MLERLGKALKSKFKNEKFQLRFDYAAGAIVIENPLMRKIQINRDLTSLLGPIEFWIIGKERKLKIKTIINQLTSFNLVHWDFINRDYGNEGGEASPSSTLVCFDIAGGPFKRVTYSSKGEIAMRKIKNATRISSMRIKNN